MEARFEDISASPDNQIFKVVFFPDRIYHAQYLNATRSRRYRYNVREVRNLVDICVLKGEVYLDGRFLSNFLRIEYRAGRLAEQMRERGRCLRSHVLAKVRLLPADPADEAEATLKLHLCGWVNAYQAEVWETLEPPGQASHAYDVQAMMGAQGEITRVPAFAPSIRKLKALRRIELSFAENDVHIPYGYAVSRELAAQDNNFLRTHEVPNDPVTPSFPGNTVQDHKYLIDFQRGWHLRTEDIPPVRYRNAMMDEGNPDAKPGNDIEMRWVLQRELGGSMVFFHEVTIPPGKVEGTHQHIGTEELYFIFEGSGKAFLGHQDDPAAEGMPTVQREVYGLGKRPCKEIPVRKGSVIYTKSGGIHGILNDGDVPLRFVAFLYHCS